MNVLLTALMLTSILAQKDLEVTTPEDPERIRVLAIHATNEGRAVTSSDPTLAPVQEFLDTLPYDTFRELSFHELNIAYGEDGQAALNEVYTFHCRPVRLTEDAEVVLEAHVDMKSGDTVVEALRVTGRAARGQGMVFRGFAMPEGEMVVVMSVAEAREDQEGGTGGGEAQDGQEASGGSGSDSSGDTPGSGSQESEASVEPAAPDPNEPEEDKDKEEDRDSMSVSLSPTEEESPLPPELANLEGILRALEEVDRREQAASRSRRYETQIRGAWW